MPVTPCIMPDCAEPTATCRLCSKHRYRAEVVGIIDWFAEGRPDAVEELDRRWAERLAARKAASKGDDGGPMVREPEVVAEADAAPVDGFARAMTQPPPGYDGALGAVQAALWMSPSTTVEDVVRVVEDLRKRERAAQDGVDEIGTLFHFVEKAGPGAVVERVRDIIERERGQRNALDNLGALVDLEDGAEPLAVCEAVINRMGALRAEIDRLRARVEELADKAQVAEIGLVLTPEEIRARYADLIRSERYLAAAQYGRRVVEPEGEVARG